MKVKCSACGAVHSLDALVANQAASDALNAALLVNGELGRALIGYLGLFRPAKSSLTLPKRKIKELPPPPPKTAEQEEAERLSAVRNLQKIKAMLGRCYAK